MSLTGPYNLGYCNYNSMREYDNLPPEKRAIARQCNGYPLSVIRKHKNKDLREGYVRAMKKWAKRDYGPEYPIDIITKVI